MPTPIPTSSTGSTSSRPANNGDTYAFNGSRTVVQQFNPFATSSPPPLPQPLPTYATQTTTTQISQAIVVSSNATFNGISGLYDFRTNETDAGALASTTSTIDNYLSFPPSATGNVYLQGTATSASSGATYRTTYAQNGNLVDTLPETAGALATAPYAFTTAETDASGATSNRSVNADGSYVENDAYPDGTKATATENSDGTGTYSLPLTGVGPPNGSANTMVTVGAPTPSATGGALVIPITIVYPPEIFGGTSPMTVNRNIADWYPNGSAVPLTSAKTVVATGLSASALPASCTSPAAVVSRGALDSLALTSQTVDTIFGELETLTQTTYTVRGYGPICIALVDVVQQYYDYTGQQYRLIGTSSVPYGISTATQTLSLQTASVVGPNAIARRTQSAGERFAASIPSYALARAAATSFRANAERRRADRHAALARTLRTPHSGRAL